MENQYNIPCSYYFASVFWNHFKGKQLIISQDRFLEIVAKEFEKITEPDKRELCRTIFTKIQKEVNK